MLLTGRRPFALLSIAICVGGLLAGLGACQTTPPAGAVNGEIVSGAADTNSRIAIATAYAPEFAALIPKLEGPVEFPVNGVSYWTGTMAGQDVVLFETGVSLVNAAMNTERLFQTFNVSSIVVSGVAGGVDPSLTIGDVTVPAKWAQYNETVYMREDENGVFKPHAGVEPELPAFDFIGTRGVRISSQADPDPASRIWFEADPELLAIARKAAGQTELQQCDAEGLCLPELPEVVIGGSGVSGSVFMDNARFREYLHEVFDAQVVEMETAAIAMVAYAHDIPFIAFRSLSDLAGGGEAETNEIAAFQHLAAVNSAAVVLGYLNALGAADEDVASPAEGGEYCEVNFSAASTYAAGALGDDFVTALRAKFADDELQAQFLSTQIDRAKAVAFAAAQASHEPFEPDVLAVWGGYKGRTDPSLALRMAYEGPEARARAEKIAASLGYVFMQESVIAHCPASAVSEASISSINLAEQGAKDVLSVDTLKPVFGLMLGQADGNFDLGFTYYPAEDRFSTLGFAAGGDFEREAMAGIVAALEAFTEGPTGLVLSEVPRWVAFPGNDWSTYPDGRSYVDTPGIAELVPTLESFRSDFLIELEAFVAPSAP